MTPTYKATDSREIPDGWSVKALGEIVSLYQPQTISAKQFTEAGYPVYGANGVVGNYHSANHETWQVTVTCRGSTCGTVNRTVDQCWITGNAMVLNCDHNPTLDKEFLYQLMLGQDLTDCITGTGQPQIVRSPLAAFRIAFPIALNEQRAITSALSDVDALIAGLERLIAKKRDIKQAAMQQLLTGQARLPGFSGEWEVKELGELCSLKSGQTITTESIDDHSPYRCFGGNGLRGHTATFTHDGHHVLIGRQGALCGNVLSVAGKFFASEHALVASVRSDVATTWLTYVLGRMNLNQYSESSAQPGLSAAKLLVLDVLTPPTRAEQTAIATVLSDMDADLATLESRRAKTRAIKQGMMQELLTGRTRLI
jgi:restriction endonuclease S subunit